ncbi:MAG: phage terminase large subunit family protein, partial [Oscillospiraceae bacterium]|nr:phage terminase large subunit family protein [Oscillospiraceae bacterium]
MLTCGVDTQNDRLEYEVVGHGHRGETWGIKKGVIPGRPDTPEVWERLDDVIDRTYRFADGRGLLISITCVDSGGHFATEVKSACRARYEKRVFAIKGR